MEEDISARLGRIEKELEKLNRKVEDNKEEDEHRKAQQEQRDTAQDSMIKIELSHISQQVNQRASREDLKNMNAKICTQLEQRLTILSSDNEERIVQVRTEMNELINNIKQLNEANSKASQLLEDRLVAVEGKMKNLSTLSADTNSELRFALQGVKSEMFSFRNQHSQIEPRLSVLQARMAELVPPAPNGVSISIADCIQAARDEFKNSIHKAEERVEEKTRRNSFSVKENVSAFFQTAINEERQAREEQINQLKVISDQQESLVSKHTKALKELEAHTRQAEHEINTRLKATKDHISSRTQEQQGEILSSLANFQKVQAKKQNETLQIFYQAQAAADAYQGAYLHQKLNHISQHINASLASFDTQNKMKFHSIEQDTSQRLQAFEKNLLNAQNQIESTTIVSNNCASNLETLRHTLSQCQAEFHKQVASDIDLAKLDMAAAKSIVEIESAQLRNHMDEQCEEIGDYTSRLQRSILNQTLMVRRLEKACRALCTRSGAGEALDTIIDDYLRSLATHCAELEANATNPQRIFSMNYDAQRFFAAAVQNVSERLALRADFECLRKMLVHDDPTSDEFWDEQIVEFRESAISKFIVGVREAANKLHPTTDTKVQSTRDLFLSRLDLGLKVGISKHQKIQPNYTLFGKLRLKPTCVACDRPFVPPGLTDNLKTSLKSPPKSPKNSYPLQADDPIDFGRNKPPTFVKRGGGFKSQRQKPLTVHHHMNTDDENKVISSPLVSRSPIHEIASSPAMLTVGESTTADEINNKNAVDQSSSSSPRGRQLSLPQL